MRLLVTRPELDAERTAAALRDRGHHVTVAPLLRVEGVAADLGAGDWDALVMTSPNSCRATSTHPRRTELMSLPVFVVGRHSAETARGVGFSDVTSAEGDGEDLARLLGARFGARDKKLLYLAGEDRAADLAAELAALGISMKTVVIYRAVKAAEFPAAVQQALAAHQIDGVLHFSRRTAEAYLSCAVGAGLLDRALAPFHYCLSPQVARPLLQTGASTVRTCQRPTETALLELVGAAR